MSSPLRSYAPRDLTRACENKLAIAFGGNRHRSGWYTLDGKKLFRIIMPKSHRDWGTKTKSNMFKQTRLTRDEFGNLVSCSMTGPHFANRARELFRDLLSAG